MLSTSLTTPAPDSLNAHDLQTRILNIRYVLKRTITEAQRERFLQLLGAAETELLEFYEGHHVGEFASIYSRADQKEPYRVTSES
jgi:hypothetical protein